jgi:uncharacterized membrane protein
MEHLVDLIIWVFTVLGLTTIVTTSGLMQPIRIRVRKINSLLGILVSCPPCFGFWAGMILSSVYQTMTGSLIFDAFLGSGLMWYIVAPSVDPPFPSEFIKDQEA